MKYFGMNVLLDFVIVILSLLQVVIIFGNFIFWMYLQLLYFFNKVVIVVEMD